MSIQRIKDRITELETWRDFWRQCVSDINGFVEGWEEPTDDKWLIPGALNEIKTIRLTYKGILNMSMKQANECQREIDHLRKKYNIETHHLRLEEDWYYDDAYDPDWFLS